MASSERRSQVSVRTVWTVGANLLALVLFLYVMYQAWAVVSWILIALLLALALDPVIVALQERGLRRGAAVALVVGGLLLFVGVSVVLLVPLLVSQGQSLVDKAPELISDVRNHAWIRAADDRYQLTQRLEEKLSSTAELAALPLLGALKDAVSGVVAFFTILTLSVFMLLFGGAVMDALFEWLSPERRIQAERVAQGIHRKVGGYVMGTLFMASIGGLVTAVTAFALGVPYFLPLGLAMTFLSIVPFIGSALGVTFLVSTTLVTTNLRQAVIALVVLVIYGQVKAKLLSPLIQRRTIQMNPLIITLVMLVGTSLAGVLGTLLALPIAGAVQVVLQEARATRRSWQRRQEPPSPRNVPYQLPLRGLDSPSSESASSEIH